MYLTGQEQLCLWSLQVVYLYFCILALDALGHEARTIQIPRLLLPPSRDVSPPEAATAQSWSSAPMPYRSGRYRLGAGVASCTLLFADTVTIRMQAYTVVAAAAAAITDGSINRSIDKPQFDGS